jgi:hypothetical protein
VSFCEKEEIPGMQVHKGKAMKREQEVSHLQASKRSQEKSTLPTLDLELPGSRTVRE